MKTTEIFVEQVLIGLLVLATGFLPYINHDKITGYFKDKSLVDGALIIAIAYLLGIVLDRFADTLLSRLEQYHRLKFASKNGMAFSGSDPFPEECLKMKIWKEGKDASEWMHYLRSRIRLSRALAIFIPALTISGLLSLVRDSGQDKDIILFILGPTALLYVFCFSIIAFVLPNLSKTKLPKTNKIDILEVKNVKGFYKCKFFYVDKFPILSNNDKSDKREYKRFSWWGEPTTIAAILLFSMMTFIAVYYHPKHACVVLITGLGISALSAWSWWRISQTYMQLLMDYNKCNLSKG